MPIWTFYNVLLPAVLPVLIVFCGLWLLGRPKPVLEIVGDGQLCFFSIALLAVMMHDIENIDDTKRRTALAHLNLDWAFPSCLVGALFGILIFWLITDEKNTAVPGAKRRLTFASLLTTLLSLIMIYYWRYNLDLFK